jgi:tRNA threonylcarbamoyl adenosine modification protein YeaZ
VLVLGIDTSTPACGVVLCEVAGAGPKESRPLSRREVVDPRRHGELLTPLISRTLESAGAVPGGLGAVVVGLGPGPYTSLRVGIVTAAALADALGIPAYGICSLDGFAPVDGAGAAVVTVATDARRREVYWARYAGEQRVAGPGVAAPAEVAARLGPCERVIGAGGELYAAVFGAAFDPAGGRFPDPAALIRRSAGDLTSPPKPLVPLYLRRPDATPRAAA